MTWATSRSRSFPATKKIEGTQKEATQIILKQNDGKPSIKSKVKCKPKQTSRSKIHSQEDEAEAEEEVEYLYFYV